MNPVIIIPSYWDETDENKSDNIIATYDHVTPISKDLPELETCLSSLDTVRGVMRVVVLLVAPLDCEQRARERVDEICKKHARLNPLVIGSDEARLIQDAITNISPKMQGETISLRGYGAIHNMGLIVACVLGHDVVVFLDDDEVALDPDFLIDAAYGLGRKNRQGLPLLAKSGYYLLANGSPYADDSKISWYDKKWNKKTAFNKWLAQALAASRISRSNVLCGGCMALHAQAFTEVAFDPWITRGEDFDYLINLRMNGLDVWFDNQWRVRHTPPKNISDASRFQQDVYRWIYEIQKIESSASCLNLRPITSQSLSPYPGKWVTPEALSLIQWTAAARAVGAKEHRAYWKVKTEGIDRAKDYAKQTSFRYFSFMSFWPKITNMLWDNKQLAEKLLGTECESESEKKRN